MWIDIAYSALFLAAVGMMLAQPLLKPKRIEHFLFAIFCVSLAAMAIRHLLSDTLGPYQYVIAMGACATCNTMWLISRAIFRPKNSLRLRHYVFAGAISGFLLVSNSIDLILALGGGESTVLMPLKRSISEIIQLVSSTTLALTFWEAVKGYSSASKTRQQQKLLFSATIGIAVFSTTVIAQGVLPKPASSVVYPWLVAVFALIVLCVTFTILLWQQHERHKNTATRKSGLSTNTSATTPCKSMPSDYSEPDDSESKLLFDQIEQLMQHDRLYLRTELKIIDIANLLNVSEYKVSRAIRQHSLASNVNHFINGYRLEHAKSLLTSEKSQQWTILVISMESGFASLAPFNRAFKTQEGCTPNQYRGKYQNLAVKRVCP